MVSYIETEVKLYFKSANLDKSKSCICRDKSIQTSTSFFLGHGGANGVSFVGPFGRYGAISDVAIGVLNRGLIDLNGYGGESFRQRVGLPRNGPRFLIQHQPSRHIRRADKAPPVHVAPATGGKPRFVLIANHAWSQRIPRPSIRGILDYQKLAFAKCTQQGQEKRSFPLMQPTANMRRPGHGHTPLGRRSSPNGEHPRIVPDISSLSLDLRVREAAFGGGDRRCRWRSCAVLHPGFITGTPEFLACVLETTHDRSTATER